MSSPVRMEFISRALDRKKWIVFPAWQCYRDGIVRANDAVGNDNPHHAGFSNKIAGLIAIENSRHEAALKAIDLHTGIPESRQLHNCRSANMQLRAAGKIEQWNSACCDVLAKLSRLDHEATLSELVEQLDVDEVHLSEVRLSGIARDAREMLNRLARVCIAFDAQPGAEHDAGLRHLVKAVLTAQRYGFDNTIHGSSQFVL